jgi:hypothetical protein
VSVDVGVLVAVAVPDGVVGVTTVGVVGGEPHVEPVVAIDACAAMEMTNSSAAQTKASPIAAPSAAGLRSSALTLHPRFS